MKYKKQRQVESKLECRATAELRREIALDLSMPDKPILDLLSNLMDGSENEEKDESELKDNEQASS
jgi:hypothetical protein